MGRLLILAAIAALGWLAWRKWLAPRPPVRREPDEFERMVSCRHCGIHVPADRAVRRGEHHYCCEAHAREAD